ncbi:MAG: DnaA/Hda family protein [Myxococcota bacterium]
MTFPPEVWDGVLHRLAAEVPVFALDSWLAPLVLEPGDDELRLLAPTAFHRNRVRDSLLPRIVAAVRAELGRALGVRVEVGGCEDARARARARARAVLGACSAPAHAPERRPDDGVAPTSATTGLPEETPAPRRVLALRATPAEPRARRSVAPEPTFDDFAVGPANALAREAALSIATARHDTLRLLYLHGAPGMGKTHLARAICSEARIRERARYTTAEAFTNAFTAAVKSKTMPAFKRRLREHCDVLVVDDVAFLAGKRGTQEELFHTAEQLLDAGGRVVLTGDRAPHELTGLEPQLRGLVARAFVAPIEAPDPALRREIVRAKAAAGGVGIPAECVDLLVEAFPGSVRDLDAALAQVVTTASLLRRPITADLVHDVLAAKGAATDARRPRPTPELVVRIVAQFFQTTPEALSSRSRRRDVLVPRQLAIFLARRFTDASLAEIGRALGREHPAVRNAIAAVERRALERAPARYQLEAVSERVREVLEGGPAPVRRPAFVRLVRDEVDAAASSDGAA